MTPPLSKSKLSEILRLYFDCSVILSDRTYSIVRESSIIGQIESNLEALRRKGVFYGTNFDCNKYCLTVTSDLSIAHAMTSIRSEGIAVGFLYYTDEEVGPHAILWFISPDLELRFIEPQSGKPKTLSDQEISSTWFVFA